MKVRTRFASVAAILIVTGTALVCVPAAQAQWDRQRFNESDRFRRGGDGFDRGNFGHSRFDESRRREPTSTSSSSQTHPNAGKDYQAYTQNKNAEQQARYNEMNTLQENQENTEKQMHNETMNTINNTAGDWGGGSSDSSTGEALGAAALGVVGGMALGSMMNKPQQQSAPPAQNPYAAPPAYYPPPNYGAYRPPAYAEAPPPGYQPYYNGSQVVYAPAPGAAAPSAASAPGAPSQP